MCMNERQTDRQPNRDKEKERVKERKRVKDRKAEGEKERWRERDREREKIISVECLDENEPNWCFLLFSNSNKVIL